MKKKTERVKLTKRVIDSIDPPESGQIFLRDSILQGFGIRFTRGSKSFILEKRIHGRPRRMTIGPYGPLTLEGARIRAKELIGGIASGQDPAQAVVDRKKELTVGALIDLYKERHLPRKRSRRHDELMIDSYLAEWMGRKISSINRKDVVSLHLDTGEAHGHYIANRLVSLIRRMWNLGYTWGVCSSENPAAKIELFKEEKRSRFLHPEEMPRLFESLKQEPNIFVRGAIVMSLLTGARKKEVLCAKWSDIDLNQAIWVIPVTKAGRPHTIPLPEPVVELLRNIPIVSGNPYVFVSGKGNSHLSDLYNSWNQIRTRAGFPDVRIHDLRRSQGSWLASAGESLPMIGRVLNHSTPAVTAVYARMDLQPVRVALESNAQRMLLAAGQSPGPGSRSPEGQENTQVENHPAV